MIWLRSGRSQNWRRLLPLAAFLTIILNLTASILIVTHLDGFLPSGFFACALTPIFGLVTLLLSRAFVRRAVHSLPADDLRRRWLKVGVFAIPVVQLFTVITLVLIAPALCTTAIRSCAR